MCECVRDVAVISFVLARPGDGHGRHPRLQGDTSVRTLVTSAREPRGRVSVHLGRARRRATDRSAGRALPATSPARATRADDRAPQPDQGGHEGVRSSRCSASRPRAFSPDGDGRRDRVFARFEIDEPARAMMLVDDRRRLLSKFNRQRGSSSSGTDASTASRCGPASTWSGFAPSTAPAIALRERAAFGSTCGTSR